MLFYLDVLGKLTDGYKYHQQGATVPGSNLDFDQTTGGLNKIYENRKEQSQAGLESWNV
jgi:hypothetical protein